MPLMARGTYTHTHTHTHTQGGVFPDAVDGAGELPFTSLMQLEITDRIVRSTTYATGCAFMCV
jgi:hypothetical protein